MFSKSKFIPFAIGLAVGSLGLYLATRQNKKSDKETKDDNNSGNGSDNSNRNNSEDDISNNSNNNINNEDDNRNNNNNSENNSININNNDNSNNDEDNNNSNNNNNNKEDDNSNIDISSNSNSDGQEILETTSQAIVLYQFETIVREEKKKAPTNFELLSSHVYCFTLDEKYQGKCPMEGFYKPLHVFIYHGEGTKFGRLVSYEVIINIFPHHWCTIPHLKKEVLKIGDEQFGSDFTPLVKFPILDIAPLGMPESHSHWRLPSFNGVQNPLVPPPVVTPETPKAKPKMGRNKTSGRKPNKRGSEPSFSGFSSSFNIGSFDPSSSSSSSSSSFTSSTSSSSSSNSSGATEPIPQGAFKSSPPPFKPPTTTTTTPNPFSPPTTPNPFPPPSSTPNPTSASTTPTPFASPSTTTTSPFAAPSTSNSTNSATSGSSN